MTGVKMGGIRLSILTVFAAVFSYAFDARCADLPSDAETHSSVYIIEFGGYGVFEPKYEGAKSYNLGFRPIIDIHESGDRVWYSAPDDAYTIDLFETANFHIGLAADLSLQNRFHNEDIDLRFGKMDVVLLGGAFAEYYPVQNVRTRVEVLQAVLGYTGLSVNLAADYIWRPSQPWTLSLGPRLQFVDDNYASDLFSTRASTKLGHLVRFNAEGGINSAGAELAGSYDWTKSISTKFFVNYSELLGDAADSPRVDLRGSSSQVTVGLGASYKLSVEH